MRKSPKAQIAVALIVGLSAPVAAVAANCADKISPLCLQTVGAGAIAAAPDSCAAQLTAYKACLATLARAAPADPVAAECDAEVTRLLWAEVEEDANCLSYGAFLKACPNAKLAHVAEARRAALACDAAANADAALAPGPAQVQSETARVAADAACSPLPEPFTAPIRIRLGQRLCAAHDAARFIELTSVQSRGVSYQNGPRGSQSCLLGEECGVFWTARATFVVDSVDAAAGEVVLRPPR